MVKVLGYSERISESVLGPPLRGFVHSGFASAANLSFSRNFFLSLNASPFFSSPQSAPTRKNLASLSSASSPLLLDDWCILSSLFARREEGLTLPLLPNGILLAAHAGEFPFSALRPGMPVLLGGQRLYFESFACSLDLSSCPQWDPHIYAPNELNRALLHINAKRLAAFCQQKKLSEMFDLDRSETILELAECICGRGAGLTPSGDDFLVGWMAVGWLLYGPQKDFLLSCQQILELARQRTHLLSQCWLSAAAAGDVAWSVKRLLETLLVDDAGDLERAASHLLTLGSSSGFDLLQGISYGLAQYGKVQF